MKPASSDIIKYGLNWPSKDYYDDALIERYMLQQGGQWIQDGKQIGNGLEYHFKQYWSALWPDDSQTKWTDLILHEVIQNQFTSIVGPASSWKSSTIARIAMMDWSLFPECTTVIVSSTDMEGLRNKIYADLSKIWNLAHELYEWFPGHPIDYKCVITNEEVDGDTARDIRNSIVGVPCRTSTGRFVGMSKYCFAAGTMVDTPNGPRPIESLNVGDSVFSAVGERKIEGCSSHLSEKLVRLHFTDGTTVCCTPDHPFLSNMGWVSAVDITPHHGLYSWHETMRIMQQANAKRSLQPPILLRQMQGMELAKGMFMVPQVFCSTGPQEHFLQQILRGELEDDSTRHCSEDEGGTRPGEGWDSNSECNLGKSHMEKDSSGIHVAFAQAGIGAQRISGCWTGENKGRINRFCNVPAIEVQLFRSNRNEFKTRPSRTILFGLCLARDKTGRGTRWEIPSRTNSDEEGFYKDRLSNQQRVDRVEILKPRSAAKSNGGQRAYRVYNIEVEGHPSYSVNGVIVHNSGRKNRRVWCIGDEYQFMQRSILDAQNNLVSNGPNLVPGIIRDPDSRENGMPLRGYKAVFIGNTNPTQPDNPLNIVSEPENGWSAIPEDGKTKVWDCKKLHDHPVKCRCICMDALDSPNADYPIDKPKWPQLAGPHKLALYTEGSESYWSQGRGPFKFGLAAFKIITKELCEQFHGFDKPLWSGKETTKIGMLDAAYGGMGGDRCMLGWLEFGECDDGVTRICFKEYWTVPVVIRKDFLPEDQIAVFCKEKMEPNGVQPDNFFFDGRGSMAISLARMWSPRVNSIEFGGRPTDRLAGPDIVFIDPKTGNRRPKLAYEHFSKFVSELWWSWHYAVESDQIRGLTMAMVMDASPREYKRVANDKIEVETKKEMKKRTGVSPDIADMVVTGIEGARRRGFEIRKFHSGLTDGEDGFNWLDDWRKSHESLIRSKQLQYK